nr:EmrB/QacA family drug resistance transporter [Candidatus Pantoea persica]
MNVQLATAPAPHPFTLRLALGLIGVSVDQGSWIVSAYQATEVAAMMIAP